MRQCVTQIAFSLLVASIATPIPIAPAYAASPSSGAERVRGDQWHLRFLKVAEAQRISQGTGITVAVPDTGVDPHPDLARNLLPGTDILPGGSGDGRQDKNSHGTSMAGLIAAHGRGGDLGALGIAPRAKILPILVAAADGEGQPDELAGGIDYAVAQGAQVISISSGGGSGALLRRSIDAALKADVVIVASAGNRPQDSAITYPASLNGVIAVAGLDRTGSHADISVTGPEVDIAAPAVDIYSTSYDEKYSKGTGTSSATAIVAGAVALIRSKFPNLSASEVARRLTATAVDKGPPGKDDQYGYGVVDLLAALTTDEPSLPSEPTSTSTPIGSTVTNTEIGQPATKDKVGATTARGLATLGTILAAAGAYALTRRRRRSDDPPPRVSR